jgi:arylsulfatase A-like enzyme
MKRANVFWISIDSLRKDFLHTYAPQHNRYTFLDELAEQGCIFDNAFPGGNWTMPSHATMLTALDVTSHMIWSWQHRFPPETQTAFDLFYQAGYTTGCFAIPQLASLFSECHLDYAGHTDSPTLLKCLESPKPFFAFWHTFNVHFPYGIAVPSDFKDGECDYDMTSRTLNYIRHLILVGQTDIIRDAYRREVQRAAQFVRGVVTKLKSLGKFEQTYFIITADHGETWLRNTTFHNNFQESVLNVPLVIVGPGIARRRLTSPVSLVDLLPTLLELCEVASVEEAAAFDGLSLAPQLNAQSDEAHHVVIAGPDGGRTRHRYLGVRNAGWMLITAMNHWCESFHQIRDDGASSNLLDKTLPEAGRRALEEFRAVAERHAERLLSKKDNVTELSTTTEKKLRALGYV